MSMGDGEHIDKVVNVGSMEDVGTRIHFLMELYELWQTGIDILDLYDKGTTDYPEKRLELVHARDMLMHHMKKDFSERPYREVINTLPFHGEDIKE